MKPGSKDKRVSLLIAGDELTELKRLTWLMSESFGLDTRIENYYGKRPIGLYSWDFECLLAIIDHALKDDKEYPIRPHLYTTLLQSCPVDCSMSIANYSIAENIRGMDRPCSDLT